MIGLMQRVSSAAVDVEGERIAAIGPGVLIMVGVEKHDSAATAERLAERLCGYRIFGDDAGRMNLSVTETGGAILLVPQFTLAADTDKGMRASFTSAAPPPRGEALFGELAAAVSRRVPGTQLGRFGANMQVSLVNDGPVTFVLRVTR